MNSNPGQKTLNPALQAGADFLQAAVGHVLGELKGHLGCEFRHKAVLKQVIAMNLGTFQKRIQNGSQ